MQFNVPNMSCGHCTAAIEASIKATDPSAIVSTDLEQHLVTVESGLSETVIQKAIADAGYDVANA